jgi:NAD-dependent deacetylase
MEHNPITFSDELVEKLRTAQRVTLLTGAGISAESGIPTFRDSQTGLWANYRPEELATPQAFQNDPQLVWEWYRWRMGLVRHAMPNAGHIALAELETRVPFYTLITQNIDGLHQKAGSRNIIELHGNLFRARCTRDGKKTTQWEDIPGALPQCPDCGALLRPDVVWFGEALPHLELQAALQASQECDLFLSIGTSGVVEPAASLPYEAIRGKGDVVEINPQPTPLTVHARYYYAAPAGSALPALLRAAWPRTD